MVFAIHQIFIGIFLGWGASIPVGPVNMEIIRRNLRYGAQSGLCFGLGACAADLTYLVLLATGALVFFTHPLQMKIVGLAGSFVLALFGYFALRSKAKPLEDPIKTIPISAPSFSKQCWSGYLMTMLNPFTIIFWLSISSQITTIAHHTAIGVMLVGGGVLVGTISWVIGLNITLHLNRHRFSAKAIQFLNSLGGLILIAFAVVGFWHSWL